MSIPAPGRRKRSFGRRERVIALTVVVIFLFASLFVQQSFDTLPMLAPESASETLILFALSTINLLAFVVLLMVLTRNVIRLRRERRENQLGSRFKVRLVVWSIALSLLPALWMFFATAGLLNRSVDKWFSRAQENAVRNAGEIQFAYVNGQREALQQTTVTLARMLGLAAAGAHAPLLEAEKLNQRLLSARVYDARGNVLTLTEAGGGDRGIARLAEEIDTARRQAVPGKSVSSQLREGRNIYLIAAASVTPVAGGHDKAPAALVATQLVPPDMAEKAISITEQAGEYDKLKLRHREIKRQAILVLALLTLFALFVATWLALQVARSIAEPLRRLLQAIQQIRAGELSTRAEVIGDDELAGLAIAFNDMTAEQERSSAALSERRRYIETVLQSLSAGVISLDENSRVTMINEAAFRLLHLEPAAPASLDGAALETLLPETQRDELWRMIRRAARISSVTREVHFRLANNVQLDAAVTVTALRDPGGKWRGSVIVLEDMSDLIEAQRRAAWSEVARRMAHEIKNPLTPIRLSAERLAKNLLAPAGSRNVAGGNGPQLSERHDRLVRECTGVITDEVAMLQRMVDEFSGFARLPHARLEPYPLNEVVESAIRLYDERWQGVRLEKRLAAQLPPVMLDPEQFKGALVNLIDNAMQAMNESAVENGAGDHAAPEKLLRIETREAPEREAVELVVTDTGPGIAPGDRERIFDPYFSTRDRGTGLGLAIVSRAIAEHHGRIRALNNHPRGARFVIELPAEHSAERAA
ncbi:MAG: ATP-binding protein [Blastocatellia bacterium]